MKKTTLLILMLLSVFVLSSNAQTNIIPVRTDVTGFTDWTDTGVAGTTYIQLLTASSVTVSPVMNFNSYTGETLNFKARTYGGVTASENEVFVAISTDNGANWTNLGSRTPTNTTLTAVSSFDLSSYSGTQIKVKFYVAGTSNTVGVGIDDITFTGVAGSACTASNLAFAQPTINKLATDGAFTQTATSLNGTTAIAYTSSNTGVATVNETTGEVIIVGAGSTIITASQAAGTHNAVDYCAATATYTVNVAAATPTITVTEISVPDMVAYAGETDTETMNVSGINLTENIALAISGTNANQFSLSTNSVSQTGGTAVNTVVSIYYNPTTAGTHTATLTISSAGATAVTRTLTGSASWKALTKPVLTGATSVSANALTLNWDAVSDATEYEVNVFTKSGSSGISTETEAFDNVIASGNLIGSATYLTGWSTNSQGTNRQIYTSSGNYGVSAPSFAFTTSGDFIETKTYSSPITSISFWAKQQTGATSSTLIQGHNGTSWVTIATLSNADVATAGIKTYDLVALGFADVVKVKLTYTKVAGNISIDDVTVISGGSPSVTPIPGSPFTVATNSKDLTGLITSTIYYYTVKAKNANVSSELSEEMSVATLGTSVSELNTKLNLRVVDGNILFNSAANQTIEFYNAVGQKLVSRKTVEGLNVIPMKVSGVVFVKLGTEVTKVIM